MDQDHHRLPALPDACGTCREGDRALSVDEARTYASEVPAWRLDGERIQRSFELVNFRKALTWVNRVGMLAEQEDHHPDFHITGWNKVDLVLWTHAVGGLSLNDFVLAKKIDQLASDDGLG